MNISNPVPILPPPTTENSSTYPKTFGDVDEEVTAQQEIEKIKQGTDTVEKYVVKFRTLQYEPAMTKKPSSPSLDEASMTNSSTTSTTWSICQHLWNNGSRWLSTSIRSIENGVISERIPPGEGHQLLNDLTVHLINDLVDPLPMLPSHNPPNHTIDAINQALHMAETGQAMDMGTNNRRRNCYYCGIAGHMAVIVDRSNLGVGIVGVRKHAANKCPNPEEIREFEK